LQITRLEIAILFL